jgi:hypothetical protein
VAVNLAARSCRTPRTTVLVTSTVKDLQPGWGLTFTPAGASAFRGVPDEVAVCTAV